MRDAGRPAEVIFATKVEGQATMLLTFLLIGGSDTKPNAKQRALSSRRVSNCSMFDFLDHQYCLSEPLSNLALPRLPAELVRPGPGPKAPQLINEICADITAGSLGRVRVMNATEPATFKLAVPKRQVAPFWTSIALEGDTDFDTVSCRSWHCSYRHGSCY